MKKMVIDFSLLAVRLLQMYETYKEVIDEKDIKGTRQEMRAIHASCLVQEQNS